MYIVWLIVVGLVAGWATGKVFRGRGYGVLADIGLGIAGSFVGGWLVRILGFWPTGGLIPAILVAILGAIVLVAAVRMLRNL